MNDKELHYPALPLLHVQRKTQPEPTKAPTILLIHGLASSSTSWNQLTKDLYNEGYNTIAPDLYGHGKSPRLPSYSLEILTEGIISSVPEKPDIIIGHSIGGLIAANLQKYFKTSKIVLVDPVFFLPNRPLLLKAIQKGFIHSIRSISLRNKSFLSKQFDKRILQKRFFLNYALWDTKSAVILQPSPQTIAACIKSQTADILIIRVKGSYIAPAWRLKGAEQYNAKIVALNGSHNIHLYKYYDFWDVLQNFFISPKTVLGNV